MNTVVLLTKTDTGVHCNALCLEKDYARLCEENQDFASVQIMDEALVRILYPEAYDELLLKDLPFCISIWIEELYQGQKDFNLDDDTIFTHSYIINVEEEIEVNIIAYVGCDAVELATLALFIKERVGAGIKVKVCNTHKFSHHSKN